MENYKRKKKILRLNFCTTITEHKAVRSVSEFRVKWCRVWPYIPYGRKSNGVQPGPYSKNIQSDYIQHKHKSNGNVGEPHTGGKNCDKRQYY